MAEYVNAPRYLLRKFCVMKLLKGIPIGCNVLEIGCGAGDLCETLYTKGFIVKGIDFSEEAIALCNKRSARISDPHKLQFSEERLDKINETFDLILILEVLEHIEDDQKTLARIYQLLKPQGHLILSVPANKKWFGPSDRYVGHFRRYDKEELILILKKNKFKVSNIWAYGVPLANVTDIIRNYIHSKKKIASKEEGTKKSGIDRSIEARFRFLLNDVCLFPFYWLQLLFISTKLGSGYIVKASK